MMKRHMKWRMVTVVALMLLAPRSALGQSVPPAAPSGEPEQPATLPTTRPAPRPTAVTTTQTIVTAFLNADEQALRRLVSLRLSEQLEPDVLRRLPGVLQAEHGDLVALGYSRVAYDRADSSLSIVTLPVFLQRTTVTFAAVVTPEAHVNGFRILSLTPRGDSVPVPEYVDPARFTEHRVEVPASNGRTLTATLALPAGGEPAPAVLLLGSAEPHNRNESLGGTHVFRDIAQGLASSGIATLRLEEHPPRVDPEADPAAMLPESPGAAEAAAALEFLRSRPDVDAKGVFIFATGFAAAPAAEAAVQDGMLAGVILAAAPARPVMDVVLGHVDALARRDGRILPEEEDRVEDAMEVSRLVRGDLPMDASELRLGAPLSHWQALDRRQDAAALEAALAAQPNLRVLILHPGRDHQVTAADLALWQERLEGSSQADFRLYPELDHLLGAGEGAAGYSDYTKPRPVASELVLDVAEWILHSSTTLLATQPAP